MGFCHAAVILGDKNSHPCNGKSGWVTTTKVTQARIDHLGSTAKTPESLARDLLDCFFTVEELSQGCCTPNSKEHKQLDVTVLDGIRCECLLLTCTHCPYIVIQSHTYS